jgi:hypothetical protein
VDTLDLQASNCVRVALRRCCDKEVLAAQILCSKRHRISSVPEQKMRRTEILRYDVPN